MTSLPRTHGSFRDPDAVLLGIQGRVFRVLRESSAAAFERMLGCPVVVDAMARGDIARTWRADRATLPAELAGFEGSIYEHEAIPFVSYPCEWSPAMLARAGELTLDLAAELLPHGLILKDATPANVLFRGASPVFVDLASIVEREPGNFLWLARHQFESTFVLPLVASAVAGVPLASSLLDPVRGLSHEACARLLGPRRWFGLRRIIDVALPAAFASRGEAVGGSVRARRLENDERARYTLQRSFEASRRRLGWWWRSAAAARSSWREYTDTRGHYTEADIGRKRAFVEDVLRSLKPAEVLDVGANTGEFSAMAAGYGRVVALEADEASAGLVFERAISGDFAVLALVADFARPTPATGWRNLETTSLVGRLTGRFDLVLMLAVIHHLRVSAGVPVAAVVDHVAGMTRSHLLIEHVPPSDPMFARIARGREDLYVDCARPAFELELRRRFDLVRSEALPNGRTLYLLRLNSTAH
jgi:SAM-dependent methyltransferase